MLENNRNKCVVLNVDTKSQKWEECVRALFPMKKYETIWIFSFDNKGCIITKKQYEELQNSFRKYLTYFDKEANKYYDLSKIEVDTENWKKIKPLILNVAETNFPLYEEPNCSINIREKNKTVEFIVLKDIEEFEAIKYTTIPIYLS